MVAHLFCYLFIFWFASIFERKYGKAVLHALETPHTRKKLWGWREGKNIGIADRAIYLG